MNCSKILFDLSFQDEIICLKEQPTATRTTTTSLVLFQDEIICLKEQPTATRTTATSISFIFTNAFSESEISRSFQPSIVFLIETSHLIYTANQITGFYMKCKNGLK